MNDTTLRCLSLAGLLVGAITAATHAAPQTVAPSPACGISGCKDACASTDREAQCSSGGTCGAPHQAVSLTPAEQKAADWAVARIREAGSVQKALGVDTPRKFLERSGIDLKAVDLEHVKSGVEAGLQASGSELSMTRCSAYGACAIGTDLTEATGPLLVKYRKQKAEDGLVFQNQKAPSFQLKDLDGHSVSLADYKGQRVALVFWQSSCSHSMKNLPIYDALNKELAGSKLRIVTVLFNGGDAPYVKQWYGPMGFKLPVLLAPDESLAEAYGSHLVPSVFLVNEHGMLVKKLVTLQSAETLRSELTAFAHGV